MSDIEKTAEITLCPFCGDWGAEVAESAVLSIHGGQKQAVYCNTCFCEGPTAERETGAVEAWNRRAATSLPEGYVLVPVDLLRVVAGCAYPVLTDLDPRGYAWSEAYLDQALPIIKVAMAAARPEMSGG